MGWKKKIKKYAKKALGIVSKVNPVIGALTKEKESSSDTGDAGMRSEAAKRLVNRNQQAGTGQINFNTEEYS